MQDMTWLTRHGHDLVDLVQSAANARDRRRCCGGRRRRRPAGCRTFLGKVRRTAAGLRLQARLVAEVQASATNAEAAEAAAAAAPTASEDGVLLVVAADRDVDVKVTVVPIRSRLLVRGNR